MAIDKNVKRETWVERFGKFYLKQAIGYKSCVEASIKKAASDHFLVECDAYVSTNLFKNHMLINILSKTLAADLFCDLLSQVCQSKNQDMFSRR